MIKYFLHLNEKYFCASCISLERVKKMFVSGKRIFVGGWVYPKEMILR